MGKESERVEGGKNSSEGGEGVGKGGWEVLYKNVQMLKRCPTGEF